MIIFVVGLGEKLMQIEAFLSDERAILHIILPTAGFVFGRWLAHMYYRNKYRKDK